MTSELLRLEKISYSVYSSKQLIEILTDISFPINENEIIGICGESGSGKTTLAKIISGLITPVSGKVIWNPKINFRNSGTSAVQMLFQNNGEILNPFRRIDDITSEALKIKNKDKSFIEKQKQTLLEAVGISLELVLRKGYELSGGEQQRTALARLLAVNPKLLILDEPFSAQDIESQVNLINLFKKINEDFNVTLLCISHDINILRKLVQRVLIMKEGKIVESGNTEEILKSPSHPYTKFLLKAENYSLSYDEIHSEK